LDGEKSFWEFEGSFEANLMIYGFLGTQWQLSRKFD
jgi:hypothetical protein